MQPIISSVELQGERLVLLSLMWRLHYTKFHLGELEVHLNYINTQVYLNVIQNWQVKSLTLHNIIPQIHFCHIYLK